MPNQLKMSKVQSVLGLRSQGWSFTRIARELGIHRETVARYVRRAEAQRDPKPTEVRIGSDDSKPTQVRIGAPPGRSLCEPYRPHIEAGLKQGLSAQRIFQDLRADHQFPGGYHSVRRFIHGLAPATPPFRRIEVEAGSEMQVDFGTGAPIVASDGRRQRAHVFRVVLSHSRKGYSEVVDRQTTENFIRCLENAFRYFGGVPQTVVIDNLRAAVTKANWYEPELNPRLQACMAHYGTVILPTRPYMPRHKGKVESGVKYVKNNALKGKTFASYTEQNAHLAHWESHVADKRLHGTTHQQIQRVFEEVERPQLQPLPLEPFPFFEEGRRKVHLDGHVEIKRAYYSVPPEYTGHEVWVRWDARLVRIFDRQMQPLVVHCRGARGKFTTAPQHILPEKIHPIERGSAWVLQQAGLIGNAADQWCQNVIRTRGAQGMRTAIGLLDLKHKYPHDQINQACETACSYGAYRLKNIQRLLEKDAPRQEQFEFTQDHPIIRSLDVYGDLVRTAFRDASLDTSPSSRKDHSS